MDFAYLRHSRETFMHRKKKNVIPRHGVYLILQKASF